MLLHRNLVDVLKHSPLGMTAVELVMEVFDVMQRHNMDVQDFFRAVESLVQFGNIREEEYTNPGMEWRVKSRYFFVKDLAY